MRVIAAVCAALRQWCRPRPPRRRGQAPTADTIGVPGTFGISAWLVRSEARRHPRCREGRTGRDPRRGRRPGHASPYPRRLVRWRRSWLVILMGPATFSPWEACGSGVIALATQGFRAARHLPSWRTPIVISRLAITAEPLLAAMCGARGAARRAGCHVHDLRRLAEDLADAVQGEVGFGRNPAAGLSSISLGVVCFGSGGDQDHFGGSGRPGPGAGPGQSRFRRRARCRPGSGRAAACGPAAAPRRCSRPRPRP